MTLKILSIIITGGAVLGVIGGAIFLVFFWLPNEFGTEVILPGACFLFMFITSLLYGDGILPKQFLIPFSDVIAKLLFTFIMFLFLFIYGVSVKSGGYLTNKIKKLFYEKILTKEYKENIFTDHFTFLMSYTVAACYVFYVFFVNYKYLGSPISSVSGDFSFSLYSPLGEVLEKNLGITLWESFKKIIPFSWLFFGLSDLVQISFEVVGDKYRS